MDFQLLICLIFLQRDKGAFRGRHNFCAVITCKVIVFRRSFWDSSDLSDFGGFFLQIFQREKGLSGGKPVLRALAERDQDVRKLGKVLLQADEARGSAVGPRGVKPVKRTFSSLQRLLKWTNVGNDVG